MDVDLIDRLVRLAESAGIIELDYASGSVRVRLVRSHAVPTVAPPVPSASAHILSAGMFGTFYRASAPDQPSFVSEGDVVAEGQVLGLLEAMKVFNRVEADRAGRITQILAENGAIVDAGAPLFAIAPA